MEGPTNDDFEKDFCQGLIDGLEYYENGDGEFLKNLPSYDATKSDFWKLYHSYYDDENYYNTWVTTALKGEKFQSGPSTQKWDQDIGTCVARVGKWIFYQMSVSYVFLCCVLVFTILHGDKHTTFTIICSCSQ